MFFDLSFLPAVCDFLLTCFSSPRYSPVFLSLGFPRVWCPVLFVFTPRSQCLLLDSPINKYCTISWSPRSLLPREPDRIPDLNSKKWRFLLTRLFSRLKSFLFPAFLAPVAMEIAARFIALAHRDLPFPEYSRGVLRACRGDDIRWCEHPLSVLTRGPMPFVPWTSQTPLD